MVYKTEKIDAGEKAKYPYTSDYEEPKKNGYLFEGWKYNGTLYEPPFNDESTNPFGPINASTDIITVWDKLNIYNDTNHTLIDGNGDTDADPTKLYYWVQSVKGKKITSGVTIEDVALDSDQLPIVFVGSGSTAVVDNKNVKTVKAAENDVNLSRFYRFKAKYTTASLESPVIEIEQVGKDQTILPDFDFLTFTYKWESTDGTDLDTATFIIGSNIPIGSDGKTLGDYPVGFGCRGSSSIDPDYSTSGSSNPELFAEVSQYIKGAGDNTASGKEAALINWKEICNRDFITQGITKLYCELYANWYNTRGNGNCSVSFQTYKTESGTGGMQIDRDETGKTKYTFSPTGDTVLKMTTNISGNVYASCSLNETQRYSTSPTGDESGYYSHVATLIYDVKTKNAVLYNKMNVQSGRNLCFDCTVNGTNNKTDGKIAYTYNDYHEWNDLFTVTFTFDRLALYLNGVENNVAIKYTDDEIKNLMTWWDGDSGWVDFVSATRDSSGYITSVTFKANSTNSSTEQQREMDIQFATSKVDTVNCCVRLQLFQRKKS